MRDHSPQLGLQGGEVADCSHGLNVILGNDGDPGTVVAAVLEALETVEQQFPRRALADVADDSAHAFEDISEALSVLGIGHLGQSGRKR